MVALVPSWALASGEEAFLKEWSTAAKAVQKPVRCAPSASRPCPTERRVMESLGKRQALPPVKLDGRPRATAGTLL